MTLLQFLLPMLIVGLGVLDVITTDTLIELGGREYNPLVRWSMKHGLWPWSKMVVHVLVAAIVVELMRGNGEQVAIGTVGGAAFIVVTGAVVLHNYFQLR